jgi:hypothetical protein
LKVLNSIIALGGESLNPSSDNRYAYSGPPDPGLEKLVDRAYNLRRSRLVDRWLDYSDLEGFTSAGKGVEL